MTTPAVSNTSSIRHLSNSEIELAQKAGSAEELQTRTLWTYIKDLFKGTDSRIAFEHLFYLMHPEKDPEAVAAMVKNPVHNESNLIYAQTMRQLGHLEALHSLSQDKTQFSVDIDPPADAKYCGSEGEQPGESIYKPRTEDIPASRFIFHIGKKTVEGKQMFSEPLADVDELARREFKNEFGLVEGSGSLKSVKRAEVGEITDGEGITKNVPILPGIVLKEMGSIGLDLFSDPVNTLNTDEKAQQWVKLCEVTKSDLASAMAPSGELLMNIQMSRSISEDSKAAINTLTTRATKYNDDMLAAKAKQLATPGANINLTRAFV